MNVSDFDYDLPDEAIAQASVEPRDAARLLVAGRREGEPVHARFRDLPAYLGPGDTLVVNDVRVRAARLRGRRATGGNVEILLLERVDAAPSGEGRETWDAWLKAARKPRTGESIEIATGRDGFRAVVEGRDEERFRLRLEADTGTVEASIERHGTMPLPPYIRRRVDDGLETTDRVRYQTMFANRTGAVAAPTAGLHFTPRVVDALEAAGVTLARVTLEVGPGTFRPVRVDRVEDHAMHAERFALSPDVADAIADTRRRGGRVVAVGTTVVRTLEARAVPGGGVSPGTGATDLFIVPGYRFRVVDAMVTNFHLPRSTLLMLVSAFSTRERILELYRAAIERGYRFYSYGDAMMLT